MRDKEALSDKELYAETASIVENVKDTDININLIKGEQGFVCGGIINSETNQKTHSMILGQIKGVEKFTLLNHELGHIMFDSPTVSARELINEWVGNICRRNDLPLTGITRSRKDGVNYKSLERSVFGIYWKTLNIIEDQRIESQMAKLWLGNKTRFNKAKNNIGKELQFRKHTDGYGVKASYFNISYGITPVECILGVRFMRDDLSKPSPAFKKAKEILTKVEGTSQKGGMIGLRMYKGELDRYIKAYLKYMKEIFDKQKKAREEYGEKCKDQPTGSPGVDDAFDKCTEMDEIIESESKALEDVHRQKEMIETENDCKDLKQNVFETMPEVLYEEDDEEDDDDDEDDEDWDDDDGVITRPADVIQSRLENEMSLSHSEGDEEITKIKIKMEDNDTPLQCSKHVHNDSGQREGEGIATPNEEIACNMNKLFKHLSDVPKKVIGFDGDEVDIESYIRNKTRGFDLGECMIDTKYVTGASILIAIDASGSMEGDKINTARELCATLFKSIESIPSIRLKCIVWSGNMNGKMLVTEVNSITDTDKVCTSHDYYLTPTHLALDHCSKTIQQMPGRNKLMIVITDGYPQFGVSGEEVHQKALITMCKRSMTKALGRCNNIIGMFVGWVPSGSITPVEEIFGKSRSMNVKDMQEGSDVISKKFKDLVVRALR
jgi:hypothetical protein